VKVISHFIKIARHLKDMGNFNGLMEIMAGFENSAVHRLKPYWEAVPEKHMRMFEHVKEVMEPKKNYAAFRAYIKRVNPPTIPYLGMYLTDLTFMEEGSPNKTKEGLINFMKRAQIAGVISDIQQYQQTPYHLKPVMVIQDYLTHAQGRLAELLWCSVSSCVAFGRCAPPSTLLMSIQVDCFVFCVLCFVFCVCVCVCVCVCFVLFFSALPTNCLAVARSHCFSDTGCCSLLSLLLSLSLLVLEEEAMYKISVECLPRGVKNITLKELEQRHAAEGIDVCVHSHR
jgi:RasGEF domain